MSLSYIPPSLAPGDVPDYSLRNDIVLVTASGDLPAQTGGYHPLNGNNAYALQGTTSLTYPITPNGAHIYGEVWGKDGLVAPAASIFKPSGALAVSNCTLDGSGFFTAIDLTGTGVEDIRITNVKFLAGASCATITNYDRVIFDKVNFSGAGQVLIKTCSNVMFVNCTWNLNANAVLFSLGGGDITFVNCQFDSTNTGTFLKFSADGGAYGNVVVVGTMSLGATKVGIDGGETGGTPATFTSAKYGVSFYTNGGTNIQNAGSWVAL